MSVQVEDRPGSDHATLRLTRNPARWRDRTRSYKVVIDDTVIGKIHNGETAGFKVPAGQHEVAIKLDWARSNASSLELGADELARFECEPAGSSLSWFLDFFAAMGKKGRPWIDLHQVPCDSDPTGCRALPPSNRPWLTVVHPVLDALNRSLFCPAQRAMSHPCRVPRRVRGGGWPPTAIGIRRARRRPTRHTRTALSLSPVPAAPISQKQWPCHCIPCARHSVDRGIRFHSGVGIRYGRQEADRGLRGKATWARHGHSGNRARLDRSHRPHALHRLGGDRRLHRVHTHDNHHHGTQRGGICTDLPRLGRTGEQFTSDWPTSAHRDVRALAADVTAVVSDLRGLAALKFPTHRAGRPSSNVTSRS